MSKQTVFIGKVAQGAMHGMQHYGILASLSIAQAILESGWGSSGLTKKANNLFGIKATSSWTGKVYPCPTKEWDGKKYIKIVAPFRAYESWSESVADHTKFLLKNKRYANLIHKTDYKVVCQLIAKDGYATSPTYARSLISLIEQYHLDHYDHLVLGEK